MEYASGYLIVLGDTLQLEAGAKGVVVGIIADGAYAPPYIRAEWAYLGTRGRAMLASRFHSVASAGRGRSALRWKSLRTNTGSLRAKGSDGED